MSSYFRRVDTASFFARAARSVAFFVGQPFAFGLAACAIFIWSLLGPLFGFSDTWQLVINTATTIITFLMVFLIQNTQNRDAQALHLKLDELIRATKGAHTAVMDSQELTDIELAQIHRAYRLLAENGRESLRSGYSDTGTPPVALGVFDKRPHEHVPS